MGSLEKKIKDFVSEQGVEVVGLAGPERLDGPPSLDPTYTLPGARSIVSIALPMDTDAIYDWLSKSSKSNHELDQIRKNQRTYRIGKNLADYLVSLGHQAREVPANTDYRRSLNVVATHPSFSHRFGAIASGIAGQGWSGNVMTMEYGAACYLGTVVTDAVLESDPPIPPRYFVDTFCVNCKLCAKTCVSKMFAEEGEEYVLLNGELHPRGKRRNIDFCNTSCFGLHSISSDLKWSTWGEHWINGWITEEPDPTDRGKIHATLQLKTVMAGDSAPRYDLIRHSTSKLIPEELMDEISEERLPQDEPERLRYMMDFTRKIGVIKGLRNPYPLSCGNCALVCSPSLKETAERYRTLVESGIVVPGPDGERVRVDTFQEAVEMRRKYPRRVSVPEMIRDGLAMAGLWYGNYFGIEPKSIYQDLIYRRKLKKALKEKGLA